MAGDYFCEAPHCKQTAIFFVLMGERKLRACEIHAVLFRHLRVTLYNFELPDDNQLYKERKELASRGLDNLDILEIACEDKWGERKEGMWDEGQMWEEVEERATQRYEEIRQDISEVRRNLIEVKQNKHSHMSYEDFVFCDATPTSLLFQLVKGGCRLPVAVALIVDFHSVGWDRDLAFSDWVFRLEKSAEDLAEMGDSDASERAVTCAKYLTSGNGLTLQQCESLIRKLQFIFARLAEAAVEENLQDMDEANEEGDFGRALMCLQIANDTMRTMECSPQFLLLSVSTTETLSQAARWTDTIPLCLLTLSTWANTPHHSDLLQILYYLANAYYELEAKEQGFAAVMEWAGKLHADNTCGQSILLCIQADKFRMEKRYKEAEHLYEQALGLEDDPTFVSICSRGYLGEVYKSLEKVWEAQSTLVDTCNLFLHNFPEAYAYAVCAHSLANLYCYHIGHVVWAERAYTRALPLYENNFSHTKAYAECMKALACLFYFSRRQGQAIPLILKACEVYSTYFSTSKEYAKCLVDSGLYFEIMGFGEEAEEQLCLANELYSAYYPHSLDYAVCLLHLGQFYTQMNALEVAEKICKAALALLSAEFPKSSDYGTSLVYSAFLFEKMDRWTLAETYYVKVRKLVS